MRATHLEASRHSILFRFASFPFLFLSSTASLSSLLCRFTPLSFIIYLISRDTPDSRDQLVNLI